MRQVVIAWRNNDWCSAYYGRQMSAMWDCTANAASLRKARCYVAQYRPEAKIFVYPMDDSTDILAKSRKKV
jgi:hypothetical protein